MVLLRKGNQVCDMEMLCRTTEMKDEDQEYCIEKLHQCVIIKFKSKYLNNNKDA